MGRTISLYGFPSVLSPLTVRDFLEQYTGEGSVDAVEVLQPKSEGSRVNAKVQFEATEDAQSIIHLADQKRLWYGNSYLKARDIDRDLAPEAQIILHSIRNVTLNFGCQMSKQKFSVLWKQENATMKFGSRSRRLYFFFSHRSADYKLELFYENIWQIELHRPAGQAKNFLLIQLLGAPRIFEKDAPILSYFKEATEDQWIREVDFTPNCCIGQSSALCLELPCGQNEIPNFEESSLYYKDFQDDHFTLENGFSFSSNLDLVPVVSPPKGLSLPFRILFKVNSLVQHGCLPGPALNSSFFKLVDPERMNIAYIERALERLYDLKESCYDPVGWLLEQFKKYLKSGRTPGPPHVALDDGLVYVRRVQVTPSKVYFRGPEVNLSNRVLRSYPDDIDNFLRVSFVDEELGKMFSTDLSSRSSSPNDEIRTEIYQRIVSTLKNGITIGDKKFEFLAFSSSQLRENSVWMFASRPGLTAADIRKEMGDFREIRNVAKYAARLGQSFSSSRETLNVSREEIETLPDIEVETGEAKYVFSDGIGKISADLASIVARKCGIKGYTPSAFQIRYGGYKGVVAVDPTSSGKLSLRKSMLKYKSNSTSLDILAWSKYQPCFLNRQFITLMSSLGVKDQVLVRKQREAIARLDTVIKDPLQACEALESMSPGENTNVLREMLMLGYKPDSEPFLAMMLQTFRASKLLELRTRARIYIPNGRSMMGCLDETGTLEYGQVFLQCSENRHRQSCNSSSEVNFVVRGKVVVAKNPCLHPGDMRVLEAIDVPALHHMVDCVVFPQKGKRPHPNECSGSDLDGDMYFVCWDSDLIPPRQFKPMDYTPAPNTLLSHDVTIEEVEEYFADYILNDSLGIISNAHIVFADRESKRAMSGPCLELAELASIAVDFPKTGVPARIPRRLRVQEYPDFMEKLDKPSYHSERAIGKLFREVKEIATGASSIRPFTKEVAGQSYDHDLEVEGFRSYVHDAFYYKSEYDNKLANLMLYYGIGTEGEILSGCIMKASKSYDRRRDLEQIMLAVKALRKEARAWFNEQTGSDDGGAADEADAVYAKASAWYHVTYHPRFWGCYNEGREREHFLSFPWCVYDKLLQIKRDKASITRALRLSSLEHSGGGLQMKCGI